MSKIPPMFEHQEKTAQFIATHPRAFNTSDPGTGKTRATLEAFNAVKGKGDRLLVLAPLSILDVSWVQDCNKFLPHLRVAVSHNAKTREEVLSSSFYDVVVTNHDAVNWIVKDKKHLELIKGKFTHIAIDEFPAFKNASTDRSKALRQIINLIEHRLLMSGTPIPNTVLDIFNPALLCDDGKRLGTIFYQFRNQVCSPVQVGPNVKHVKWVDKPGAVEMVTAALSDITIRFALEQCLDMPEHFVRDILYVKLPPAIMQKYKEFEAHAILETERGNISAVHAGALAKKLLQLASGAVYDSTGTAAKIHDDRYKLVLSLVEERQHSLVAYNWKHEREALCNLARKLNISHAYIDGEVSQNARTQIVNDFQMGRYQVLFAQPQAASHGLTLTKAKTIIWCSPTYNAEHYLQFNRRIYRAGQTEHTEIIRIASEGTREGLVYTRLGEKVTRQDVLLDLFTDFTLQENAA